MLTANSKPISQPMAFFLVLLALPSLGAAQQPPSEATIDRIALQAFTAQIHQLRIAIEQTVSVLPRMQVALTRFQMQQARVDRLNEELQNFRSQLESNVANRDQLEKALRELENQTAAVAPGQRTRVEEQKRIFKLQLEEQSANVQEQRSKEIELSSQVQKERAVLSDLTERLNAIEKALQHVQ